MYRDTVSGAGRLDPLTEEQRRLIESHLSLARALARRFANRGEPLDDLEQVAMIGLVKVARRYDVRYQVEFSSYAAASILGELKRHFRDYTWIWRVPRRTQEMYLVVKAAKETLEQDLGRSANISEVSAYLGTSDELVLEAMDAAQGFRLASLDAPMDDSQTETRATLATTGDGSFDRALDREALRKAMPTLGEADRTALKHYFFDGWTQCRIAQKMGVSQMQVSRILHRALGELRRSLVDLPS